MGVWDGCMCECRYQSFQLRALFRSPITGNYRQVQTAQHVC